MSGAPPAPQGPGRAEDGTEAGREAVPARMRRRCPLCADLRDLFGPGLRLVTPMPEALSAEARAAAAPAPQPAAAPPSEASPGATSRTAASPAEPVPDAATSTAAQPSEGSLTVATPASTSRPEASPAAASPAPATPIPAPLPPGPRAADPDGAAAGLCAGAARHAAAATLVQCDGDVIVSINPLAPAAVLEAHWAMTERRLARIRAVLNAPRTILRWGRRLALAWAAVLSMILGAPGPEAGGAAEALADPEALDAAAAELRASLRALLWPFILQALAEGARLLSRRALLSWIRRAGGGGPAPAARPRRA